jgi:hypothetical protein
MSRAGGDVWVANTVEAIAEPQKNTGMWSGTWLEIGGRFVYESYWGVNGGERIEALRWSAPSLA